jgi:hypothetical protein
LRGFPNAQKFENLMLIFHLSPPVLLFRAKNSERQR